MKNRTTVGAIIPAYNEGVRIGKVLGVLRQVKTLKEIVIVDDGSSDGTADAVREAAAQDERIQLVSHTRNLGKGQAFYTGIRSLKSSLILMLDADLVHLEPAHVEALIEPVLTGITGMTMGVFRAGQWNTDIAHTITPWLTGQRCFRSELIRHVQKEAALGYGLETALTVAAHRLRWNSYYVPWVGVTHPPSEIHRGLLRGAANRAKMYVHVIRALILTLGWKQAYIFFRAWKLTM